jgi:hypothetical protein
MKFGKELEARMDFAGFCRDNDLTPYNAACLVQLARRAHAVGVRNTATNNKARLESARRALDDFAQRLGYSVDWAGRLWPALLDAKKNTIRIPSN